MAAMASSGRAMGGALLDRLDRALQVVEFATAVVGGVVIFGVMWIGVAEMIMRKAFNAPLYGQLDLIEQTMAAYTLLTISYCYRKAGHIRVDILVGHFKGRRKWIAAPPRRRENSRARRPTGGGWPR